MAAVSRERHRGDTLHFRPDALQIEGNPRADAAEADEDGEEEPAVRTEWSVGRDGHARKTWKRDA